MATKERHLHPTSDTGTLDVKYTDESGTVSPDIYAAAGRVWRRAQTFYASVIKDMDDAHARVLLFRASTQVTRDSTERGWEVNELDDYILQVFKRLVLAELEKDNGSHRIELNRDFEMQSHVDNEQFLSNQNITTLLGGVIIGAIIGEVVWTDPGKAAVVGIVIAFLFILLLRKRRPTQKNSNLPV